VPCIYTGAADLPHFEALSDNLCHYTFIRIGSKDFMCIHGVNERIAVRGYENAIRFYFQLITNTVINPISPTDE